MLVCTRLFRGVFRSALHPSTDGNRGDECAQASTTPTATSRTTETQWTALASGRATFTMRPISLGYRLSSVSTCSATPNTSSLDRNQMAAA
jgi:hypothetical protein